MLLFKNLKKKFSEKPKKVEEIFGKTKTTKFKDKIYSLCRKKQNFVILKMPKTIVVPKISPDISTISIPD